MIRFSIIIPTYNRAHTISRAIDSCIKQSYTNWEIIVIDDGSTDSTAEVLKPYIMHSLIIYIYTPNVERGAARNLGIRKSSGTHVTFLDSDDIYHENYLLNAFMLIQKKAPMFFHQSFELVNEHLRVIRKARKHKKEDLLSGNFMACMGVFVQRELLITNMFNEDRTLAGSEDYELWLRLYSKVGLVTSNEVQAALVIHSQRSELNIDIEKFSQRICLLIKLIKDQGNFNEGETRIIISNIYMYSAITLLEIGEIKTAVKEFLNAVKEKKRILQTYKTISFWYHFTKKVLGRINYSK